MKRASKKKIAIIVAVLICLVTASGCGARIEDDEHWYTEPIGTTEYIKYSEDTDTDTESESQTMTTVESEVSTYSTESCSIEQENVATTEETTLKQTDDEYSVRNTEGISLSVNTEEDSKQQHEVEIVTMVEEPTVTSTTEVPTYYTTTEVPYTGTIAPGFDTNSDDEKYYIPTTKGTTTNAPSEDEIDYVVTTTSQPYETVGTYESSSSFSEKKITTSKEVPTTVTTVVETQVPTTTQTVELSTAMTVTKGTTKLYTTVTSYVTKTEAISGTTTEPSISTTTEESRTTTTKSVSITTTEGSSTSTTKAGSTTTDEDKVKVTTTSGGVSNNGVSNAVSPSKYNIKASDDKIVIDETVMTGQYGLLNLYEKYEDYHIAWKLKSLDTGKSLEFNNSDLSYVSSCCTIKAALALFVCQQLEDPNCKETLDTKIYYDKTNTFQTHGGSGDIQKYGSQYYTIRELLGYCIRISDNDAYCVLLEHFGISNFNKWLQSIGSTSCVSVYNVMGCATLDNRTIEWEAIVEYCFNKKNSYEIRTYLWEILTQASSSPIRTGLAKYTNLDCTVTHKSGWYNGKYYGTSNDCGIITLKDGRQYLMIILTEKAKGKYDNDLLEAISADLTRFMDSLN